MAKSPATTVDTGQKVTRDDLERRFRSVQEGMRHQVDDKKRTLVTVAAVAGVVVVTAIFLLGRRSGNKKTTLVEIRRV